MTWGDLFTYRVLLVYITAATVAERPTMKCWGTNIVALVGELEIKINRLAYQIMCQFD